MPLAASAPRLWQIRREDGIESFTDLRWMTIAERS
jgi:hypothetical protein